MSEENAVIEEREIHEAAKEMINRVERFDQDARRRVFQKALGFFQIIFAPAADYREPSGDRPQAQHGSQNGGALHFADRAELPPKGFLFQKQPQTDIERIACLAYYLSHYRDMPHFKTLDISKLNTEAAQTKFSNTAFAVVNATNAGLLVSAGKGFKQLSAVGERYVDALPDRDKAKEVLADARIRRRRKSSKSNGESK